MLAVVLEHLIGYSMFPHDHSIRNINFVGPIVRVLMENRIFTGTSGNGAPAGTRVVAEVYFDACGCSGTFAPSLQDAGYFRRVSTISPPINFAVATLTKSAVWSDGVGTMKAFGPDIGSILLVDGFTALTGTAHSFRSLYTQLYDVDYSVTFRTTTHLDYAQYPCRLVDYDYSANFYLGGLFLGSTSGTFTWNTCSFFSGSNVIDTITGTIRNFYMQAGEGIDFTADFTFVNRSDYSLDLIVHTTLPTPLEVGLSLNSGFPNSVLWNGYRTSFRPHSTYQTP